MLVGDRIHCWESALANTLRDLELKAILFRVHKLRIHKQELKDILLKVHKPWDGLKLYYIEKVGFSNLCHYTLISMTHTTLGVSLV